MPEWQDSGGSYQDLSAMPLAKSSMWPSSQAAGNMTSSNAQAMTAPGSDPVDPLPDRAEQGDPSVTVGKAIPPGTDGKPQASGQAGPAPRRRAAWGRTTTPDVLREKQ